MKHHTAGAREARCRQCDGFWNEKRAIEVATRHAYRHGHVVDVDHMTHTVIRPDDGHRG